MRLNDPRRRARAGEPRRFAASIATALASATLLAGCALAPPEAARLPELPQRWTAPLPHGGDPAALTTWWSQFDDPELPRLIDAAQRAHGSVAQAAARIREARALARAAGSAAWPSVSANASGTRSRSVVAEPPTASTVASAGLDASWEIDLFGVTRNNVRAADARAEGALASWHDARVSLAAEVASTYVGLRACELLVGVYQQDSASQERTAELTRLKVKAGFEAPASGALSDASAAESSNRRVAQQADCDAQLKGLVALTAVPEAELQPRMSSQSGRLPQPRAFALQQLPAALLAQRPDLAVLEREVAAAAAGVGAAQADRYPRLSLTGSIAAATARVGGSTLSGSNWSVGPALSLPLFDAGRRVANVDAARARYDEAAAAYTQRARDAVREVEEALVRLDSATRRETDAVRAARGFGAFFDASRSRWEIGAGSLLDLEDARRIALTANATLINVQRERVAAWIALYKAVGGGWVTASSTQISLNAVQR